nr:hypothetical protein [uncultured Rhodoferax sp.]
MEIDEQAELLEELLTFDKTDYPHWRGDVGKCWVDVEKEEITIVGWYSDMGAKTNSYRLIVQYKTRNNKSGAKSWIEATGWDDNGKEIKEKVFGSSFADAVDVLLQYAQEGGRGVRAMATVVANQCTVKRNDPNFGQPTPSGEFPELIFSPTKPTPQKGRPIEIGGKRIQVYLDDISIEVAKIIGNDNVSEGIRKSLAHSQQAGLGS